MGKHNVVPFNCTKQIAKETLEAITEEFMAYEEE